MASSLLAWVFVCGAVACGSSTKSSGSGGSAGAAGSGGAGKGGAAGSAGAAGSGGSAGAPADAGADAAADSSAGGCSGASHDVGQAITIAGDPGNAPLGYGDPSLLYADGDMAGLLSYTAVGPSFAETRVALVKYTGVSWQYVSSVNSVTPITVTTTDMGVCGATSCDGNWVHETSSIVLDSTATDPAQYYKVFAHSYFIPKATGQNHYEIGSIDMWTAFNVDSNTTWKETRLLGWKSSSPRSSTGVATVVTTDPALSPLLGSCTALTEPAALVVGSQLYLALACVRYVSATSIPVDIVMISSSDHGATWQPVGKLLDAGALGGSGSQGPEVNGADLFQVGGSYYLFATTNGPVSDFATPDGYRGCSLIPFSDIATGTLERCNGAPHVIARFQDPSGHFNGACTYAAGATAAGVMGLTAATSRSPVFQIYATGVTLP